jgi:hypothetical protein
MSIKYNIDELNRFCNEQNIQLCQEYIKVNNKTVIQGICLNKCGYLFEKTFFALINYSGGYCKSCVKVIRQEKFKKTCLVKYGVKNPYQSETIKHKIKQTNLEKYGETCYLKTDIGKIKSKQTINKKYGVENVSKSDIIKMKKEETSLKNFGVKYASQNESIKKQIKKTNNEKYGCDYVFQNEGIKEKIKNTCLKKYNVNYIGQSNEIKEKIKQSNLEKYGLEYATQCEEIKEKTKQTNLEKYGVENPIQDPEIAEKASENSYQTKFFTFPSGKIIRCQGYEPFALEELVKLNFDENDIYTKRTEVPKIIFNKNGKNSRHYVDIYIKSLNKCIEVKSDWYFNKDKDVILAKQSAGKNLGSEYEIWVYDKKGNKTVY